MIRFTLRLALASLLLPIVLLSPLKGAALGFTLARKTAFNAACELI